MTYQWHRNEFDKWRALYPWMTHAEQCDFYNQMVEFWPDQKCYDAEPVVELVKSLLQDKEHIRIVELGGHDGALAAEVLSQFSGICGWVNFEISNEVVRASVANYGVDKTDTRYWVRDLLDNPMWVDHHSNEYCDLFIASHVIEHLSLTHFCRLAEWLRGVPVVHFQAPLNPTRGNDWSGYVGSHILPVGWTGVCEVMRENCFRTADSGPSDWYCEYMTFEYQAERPEIGYTRTAEDLTEADACVQSVGKE